MDASEWIGIVKPAVTYLAAAQKIIFYPTCSFEDKISGTQLHVGVLTIRIITQGELLQKWAWFKLGWILVQMDLL